MRFNTPGNNKEAVDVAIDRAVLSVSTRGWERFSALRQCHIKVIDKSWMDDITRLALDPVLRVGGCVRLALKLAILRAEVSQREVSLRAAIPETRLSQIVRGRGEPTAVEKASLIRVLGSDALDEEAVRSLGRPLE